METTKNQFIFTVDLKNDKQIKKGNYQIRLENLIYEYFGRENVECFQYEWNPLGEEIIKIDKRIILNLMDSLVSYFDSKHEKKIALDIKNYIDSIKNR